MALKCSQLPPMPPPQAIQPITASALSGLSKPLARIESFLSNPNLPVRLTSARLVTICWCNIWSSGKIISRFSTTRAAVCHISALRFA